MVGEMPIQTKLWMGILLLIIEKELCFVVNFLQSTEEFVLILDHLAYLRIFTTQIAICH